MIEAVQQSPDRLAAIRSRFPQIDELVFSRQDLAKSNQLWLAAALRDTLRHIAFLEAEHTRLSAVLEPTLFETCSDDENS